MRLRYKISPKPLSNVLPKSMHQENWENGLNIFGSFWVHLSRLL